MSFAALNARCSRALLALSHLAIPTGCYVAASTICVAQLASFDRVITPRLWAFLLTSAFTITIGIYLFDRVKLRDAWLDPADKAANPEQFHFLSRRARRIRFAAFILLILATIALALIRVPLALLPVIALVGIILYAGQPRTHHPRPKDILHTKNAITAIGIVAFSTLIIACAAAPQPTFPLPSLHWLLPVFYLFIRTFADAALCDLDDERSDRRFGTTTLPVRLGRSRAWNLALSVRLVLAAALIASTLLPGPHHARIAWGIATALSSLAMRFAEPARVRDWVDLRFAIEALAVTIFLVCDHDSIAS